jgi:hypothetical protein
MSTALSGPVRELNLETEGLCATAERLPLSSVFNARSAAP